MQAVRGKNAAHYVLVYWEDILEMFKKALPVSDADIRAVVNSLDGYLKESISFLPDFEKRFEHLFNNFPDSGNAYQQMLVKQVWQFFPNAGGRISSGASWVGYYFNASADKYGWYGFIRNVPGTFKSPVSNENNALFIIAANYKPESLSDCFESVELASKNFLLLDVL